VTRRTKVSSENDSDNSNSTMIDLTWPKPVKDKIKDVGKTNGMSTSVTNLLFHMAVKCNKLLSRDQT
jgi:hypothetical protein